MRTPAQVPSRAVPERSTSPHVEDHGFVEHALEQRDRVDELLAMTEKRRVWFFPAWWCVDQREVRRGRWRDPEFLKNLRIFGRLVDGAVGVAIRQKKAALPLSPLASSPTLCRLASLPPNDRLTLKTLIGRRFQLEHMLIEIGDEQYLAGRVAELYCEGKATNVTWRKLFGEESPVLLHRLAACRTTKPAGNGAEPDGHRSPDPHGDLGPTKARLAWLLHAKEAEYRLFQARGELKRRTAIKVTVMLAGIAAGFGAATALLTDNVLAMFAVAAGGAAGATLGCLIKLRDQLFLGAQVRAFQPFLVGQVIVGATAGIVTLLVQQARLIPLTVNEVGVAALAFAVGFSEAAFVGLLGRLAGAADEAAGDVQASRVVP